MNSTKFTQNLSYVNSTRVLMQYILYCPKQVPMGAYSSSRDA